MREPHRSRIHQGVGGPLALILLGVLFLLNEFVPSLTIDRTWPVILIVAGLMLLARAGTPPRPPQGPRI